MIMSRDFVPRATPGKPHSDIGAADGSPDVRGTDGAARSRSLIFEAWEIEDSDKALEMAEDAMALNPMNPDAHLFLLDYAELSPADEIESVRKIIALGAMDLGARFFEQCMGRFWGVEESRPYMRARAHLVALLLETGQFSEMAKECEEILRLNPQDNQGMRYSLIGACLATRNLERVRELLRQFNERSSSAYFAWAYVLERFLSGDVENAAKGLEDAKEQNPYALAYLTGVRQMPKYLPESYSMGSREEAILCADLLAPVIRLYADAARWIDSQKPDAAKD